jgi:hypothetical protein
LCGGIEENHEHLSGDPVFRERLEPGISGIQVKGQYEVNISKCSALGKFR